MKNLREAFEEKANKESDLMDQKKSNFEKALNEVIFEKNKSTFKLQNLRKEFEELDRLVDTGTIDLEMKDKSLTNKLAVAGQRYSNAKRQEKRLQKIIEICFLNKDLNEEWIRVTTPKANCIEVEPVHYQSDETCPGSEAEDQSIEDRDQRNGTSRIIDNSSQYE